MTIIPKLTFLLNLMASLMLTACATPELSKKTDISDDPWVGWNKGTQAFNDTLDKHILKPVALAYVDVTNAAIDRSVSNFFSNINDVGVSINDVFQLKFLNSGMDISRFMINTTVGLGGIFDVASSIDLPKHNEDFGQTLGYWGVPAGPYLVLPFFGPSNPRDTVGIIGDALLNPLTYVSFFGGSIGSAASLGASTVNVADKRASLIPAEKVLNEGSTGNRYDFLKSSYQQNRNYLINDGKVPDSDDPLELLNSDESANPIKTDNSVPPKGKKPVVQVLPIEVK